MKLDVTYQNDKISFIHLRKKNIRHVYLTIDKKNGVTVKSHQRFSADQAKRLVLEKAEWILEKIGRLAHTITTQLPEPANLQFLFLNGRKIPLKLFADTNVSRTLLTEENDSISIRYHPDKPALLLRAIDTFYRKKSEELITPIVSRISPKMALIPTSVAFKKYKRRWGCCDVRNNLIFNTLLAQFSDDVLEYIVIHELAHIKEKNHSKRFWQLVETYCPEYKIIHQKIKGVY